MTFKVSCRTWLSELVAGRVVLPRPEPIFDGTLLTEGGGMLLVVLVDWKELMGVTVATGFGSGTGVVVWSSSGGGLAAGVVCSLDASARGVRGGFGGEKAEMLTMFFGAGRVYTFPCQPRRYL